MRGTTLDTWPTIDYADSEFNWTEWVDILKSIRMAQVSNIRWNVFWSWQVFSGLVQLTAVPMDTLQCLLSIRNYIKKNRKRIWLHSRSDNEVLLAIHNMKSTISLAKQLFCTGLVVHILIDTTTRNPGAKSDAMTAYGYAVGQCTTHRVGHNDRDGLLGICILE